MNKTLPVISLAATLALVSLGFMSDDQRWIAVPGLASSVLVLWLWTLLWDRDKRQPLFDIGMICAAATCVYTVYPLMNYWVDGMQFGLRSDIRLRSYHIPPAELGQFHFRHVAYLASLVAGYATCRKTRPIPVAGVGIPARPFKIACLVYFIALSVYFVALQLATGANYNASYDSQVSADNLVALGNLPLIVLQISGKLAGILFVFKLTLLLLVVSRCRERRWLLILIGWIAVEIIRAVLLKGARSEMIYFLIGVALFYDRLVKPLSTRFLITSGASVLVLFILLGLYRSYADVDALRADLSPEGGGVFSAGNEFQALLGTAYDVLRRKQAGAYLPWYLHINDFIGILPPQQIVPFEKVPANEWYLRELHISGTGVGLMWGVITQSIVGLDWFELIARGAVLGSILAWVHGWYVRHQASFLATLFYAYLCIKVYYTFRDTTFSILSNVLWEIIPYYILILWGAGRKSLRSPALPNPAGG